MKPYFAAMAALGLLASTPAYAQQTQATSDQQGQEAGQQGGQRQELSPRFVKQIQSRLHQQGFYDGKATGTWDEDTSDALQSFQEANGLQSNGQLDGMTILVLSLPTGQQAQQQQAAQLAPQGRATRQMGGPMMGGPTSQTGQADQSQVIDAYQAGYQHGFQQGFRQSEMMAAVRQGQGTAQGSSQPPQQYRGGQQ
ncbi:MAG TPA: peptidoglycan-binding domain-containing protein [Stellaceae bacterium]